MISQFDLSIFAWFNGLAGQSRLFDLAAAGFTTGAPLVFAALFAVAFFRRSRHQHETRRTVLLAGLSGVVALLLNVALGFVFYRARPFAVLPPEAVHLLTPHAMDSSFPSDHTTASAAFAAGMWYAPDRDSRWVFTCTAILVGLSRLVAGVHWPSDVLASFLLGSAVAWLFFAATRPLLPLLDRLLDLFAQWEQRLRSGHVPDRR